MILIGTGVTVAVARGITRPMDRTTALASRFAAGKGNERMQTMLAAMTEINGATQQAQGVAQVNQELGQIDSVRARPEILTRLLCLRGSGRCSKVCHSPAFGGDGTGTAHVSATAASRRRRVRFLPM